MAADRRGVFAISWEQTEIDGMAGAPPDELAVGVSWCWGGEALRVDGPARLMPLSGAAGAAELGARAARKVRRLAGTAPPPAPPPEWADAPPAAGFTVTDGRRAWTVAVATGRRGPILVLDGDLPPPATELWVVRRSPALGGAAALPQTLAGFAAGTRVATPAGTRPVEDIRAGELVHTCDDGPQPVVWAGRQALSGARLRLRPALRPIRIPAALAGRGRPERDLIVMPRQEFVVAGRAVAAPFGEAEALVAAADLAPGWPVRTDHGPGPVICVQLVFARPQIVLAEGRAAASHAAAAAGGPPARRLLTRAEAAILAHRRPPLG